MLRTATPRSWPSNLPSPLARARLILIAVLLTAIAESIGTYSLRFGPIQLTILPMLWALLLGILCSANERFFPEWLRIDHSLQSWGGQLLNIALLLFIAKLGSMAGNALPQLRQAGWALCFQEFGHALGTLALALPLALLLGIKREAVGATFSIGRENTVAIIAERYGLRSPEGYGVMAEYITGTVLGTLFIAILVSLVASLGIFDPRSLAMGAGMGSGSMMAAALGVIVAQQPESMRAQLSALAAASNLIAGVAGFYFALFLSLPLCNWLYGRLEPVLGRFAPARSAAPAPADRIPAPVADRRGLADHLAAWLLMLGGVTISSAISARVTPLTSLPGLLIMSVMAAIAVLLKRCMPRLPLILLLSALATVASAPGLWPLAGRVTELSDEVQFMSLTTPVLALAGLSVAKDLSAFRRLGWRIVVVSLTATAGTFLGAALIAELFHRP